MNTPNSTIPPPSDPHSTKPPAPATVQSRHPELEKFIAVVSLVCILIAALIAIDICLPLLPKKIHYSVERASAANLSFAVRANSNHRAGFSFNYEKIDAILKYRARELISAEGIVPPFHQPRRNATDFELDMKKGKVLNESLGRELRMERGPGYLNMTLIIMAKMRLELGVLKVINRRLNVTCGPLKVPISPSGAFERVSCGAHMSG